MVCFHWVVEGGRVGNPWTRQHPQFNKDRLQRDVSDAKRIRESGRGDGSWNAALHKVQTELRAFDAIIRRSHEQRRPGESGSPRTQGKDTAEGLAARAANRLADGLEHAAKAGKQKVTTLQPPNGPAEHRLSPKDLAGTFDAVLAIVMVFRVWLKQHWLEKRQIEAAQKKGEQLKASVEQLTRKLR